MVTVVERVLQCDVLRTCGSPALFSWLMYSAQTANCKLQTVSCKLYLANWRSSIHPPRHWLVFDNNFEHVCREFNFCLSRRFAQIAFSSVQSQKLTELASLNSRSWRMATLERTLNSRKWQIPRKEANPVGKSSWQIQLANPIGSQEEPDFCNHPDDLFLCK